MARSADFTQATIKQLASKVGYRCSNPFCRKETIGTNADGSGLINIGEAAHITAAEPGGPRYDPSLTTAQRKSESNGIWLCRNHAAMIDRDVSFFTVDLIRHWKANAEKEANERIQGIIPSESIPFTLRELYDDFETCCKMIDYINTFDTAVVVPPSSFPVTSEYEKRIESIVDAVGMNYASRMRRCFAAIFNFRGVVEEEYPRHKNCLGRIADAEAVRYSHRLNAFLSQMEEYDIRELVDTIRKLFKV